jgi:hypothetical protein
MSVSEPTPTALRADPEPLPGVVVAPEGARFLGRAAGFLLVVAQLALLLVIVRLFDVAGRNHFFPVLCLVVGGYLVHAWLPARWRAPFFCALSLGGILFVLGWPNGGYVIGIGAGLIALCHLPVPFVLRVTMIVVAGVLLALFRLDYDRPFWPVLGSMFMFRLIGYLHDLRHGKSRFSPALTTAYFFPLPNVSFLFFPILDFKTFRETYQPRATWEVAQGGIGWIVQGLSQLLLYRVIKYYWLPSPHELGDAPHLLLFLAMNYALYLHVSGYFHVITGIFHLFGFQLPRTHHNYFLASSFTDIWRRINIYWKDFLAKIFFFPTFFALRGWGTRPAAVVAALGVFLATWLLHAYQVFWITGSLPLTPGDALLWLIVGVLVAWNLQLDLRRAARRRTPDRDGTPLAAISLSARIVGMFLLVSFFWACWNTPAFAGYLHAQLGGNGHWLSGWGWVLGLLLTAIAVGAMVQLGRARLLRSGVLPLRVSPARSGALFAALLAAVAVVGSPGVSSRFGPRAAGVLAALRNESASAVEAAQAVQGYYEDIADAPVRAGSWLAALEGRPTPPHRTQYTDMTRPADELLKRELIPNWSGEVEGHTLTVNRFGMRDRLDRTQAKPPGTRRIACVGSSVVMGYGVNDDATFPYLLEERLNAERPSGRRYEVLNFGLGRSDVIQRHVLIDRKVWPFDPDVIFYVAHQDELLVPVRHLNYLLSSRTPLPYPCLADVVRRAGITLDTPPGIAEARLHPFAREILLGVYRDLVADCRRRGVRPVWIYLPMPGVVEVSARSDELVRLAGDAGFAVVNLADWADGHRPMDVKVNVTDHHANTLGHRIIAAKLDEVLRRRPELLTRDRP